MYSENYCVELGTRSVLEISGLDSVKLLQGLVSNDVESVSAENSIYAALLTPQGKFLYDFLLQAMRTQCYWIVSGGTLKKF